MSWGSVAEFIRSLNWVDYVIFFGFLRGAFVGYNAGVFRELLRIVLYIVTLCVLVSVSDYLAEFVSEKTFMEEGAAQVFVIAAVTVVTYLLLKILVDFLLKLASLDDSMIFKIMGLFVGMVRWGILLSAIFWTIGIADIAGLGSDVVTDSRWGPYLAPIAPTMIEFTSELVPHVGATS